MKAFRIIALLEGVSFLLLLLVGVPLKYMMDMPLPNKIIGMIHGLLFIAYVVQAYQVKESEDWSMKQFLVILIASIVPGGTFYADKKYLRA